MDLKLFGQQLQLVREDVLKETQRDFAPKVGLTQVLLSRLERGIGGEIKSLLAVLEYLNNKGFPSYLLFSDNFKLSEFIAGKRYKEKNNPFEEFGKNMRTIREDLLKMTQNVFAQELRTRASLYGRLEGGIGANIHIIFEIINFLNNRNYNGIMLFKRPFDMNNLMHKNQNISTKNKEAIAELKSLQTEFNNRIENIIRILMIQK